MAVEVRLMRDEDREAAMPIYVEAFGHPPGVIETAVGMAVADRWVVTSDDVPLGLLRVLRVGHFFGGRSVPSADIAAVAVATQARGRGLGRELMRGLLRGLHEEGTGFSTLYPASMRPYRGVGYEIAGERIRWAAPLETLPKRAALEVDPLGDGDMDAVAECNRRFGARGHGLMDRPDWWWEPRVLSVDDNQALYRYGIRDGDRLRGYVLFTQHFEQGHLPDMWIPGDETPYAIATRDLVWQDEEAAATLLAFAAGHSSVGTRLLWTGPSADPLLTLFADRQPVVSSSYRWMARIANVAAAFEARGWPAGVDVSVELEVDDPDVPANAGAYRIEVADGNARVERIDSAAAHIDVGALSALYTGWLAPRAAVALGRLTGASDGDLDALSAALAAPTPWMVEFF